jgi:DNA polymerase-3 subunit epsilon
MEAYAEWYGDWNSYHGSYTYQKLTNAARRFGVTTEGAHSALADCLMTLAVIKAMTDQKNP